MDYKKQLLTEIHKYNHLETSETAFLSNNDLQYEIILHNNYTVEGNIVKIYGLKYGIYFFNEHIFLLDTDLGPNDYIEYKKNIDIAHIVTNKSRRFMKLYNIYNLEFDNGTGILENTINTEVDRIFVTGNTDIVFSDGSTIQSPSSPAILQSTTRIELKAISVLDPNKYNNFEIRLTHSLKSLPSGIGDILVIDNINSTSIRITKVGRLIINGIEEWEKVEELSNTNSSVFYLPFNLIQLGNNTSDIVSNYFPTIKYNDMVKGTDLEYAISNSNDPLKNGIFIKVKGNQDIDSFREFLNNLTEKNPIIIEYLLKDYVCKDVSLDKYDLLTYHNNTKIVVSNNVKKISFFCKTFNTEYANLIPSGTSLVTLHDAGSETWIYASGRDIYKYNHNEVRLYSVMDDYYGSGNGQNTVTLPDEDYYIGDTSDAEGLNYYYYISNNNLLIDKKGYVPVGGIIHWYVEDSIPDGFLLYRGEEISRAEYKELFDVIGTSFGEGDGSTTFNLPNQDYNEENISQEEIDSIGFNYLICYKSETLLSIGTCLLWYGDYNVPPAGYIQADGRYLNKIDYNDLYKLIGNKYGETETEFKIPDQNVYLYDDLVVDYAELYNFSYIIKAF